MFLSRAARCRFAASPSQIESIRLKANVLFDVTSSLRKGHALQGHRYLHASVAGDRSAHLRQPLIRDPGRLTRLPSAASLGLRGPASAGHVLFTGRLWSSGVSTMQPSRFSSTAPSSKNPEQADQSVKEVATPSSAEDPGPVKPSKTQQLKKVFKEYGAVGVSFHISISLMSLGMCYLLISSGLDIVGLLSKLGFSETILQSKVAAGTSTFVLAYAVHKLFAPARISITLVSVPLIVRYLRKTGLFKPPTPAP